MHRSQRMACVGLTLGLAAVGLTSPAAAGGAEQHLLPDLQVTVDNPCSGQPTLLTFTGQRVLFRQALDGNDKLHLIDHVRADWHTEDGFSGRFRDTFGVLDADPGTFTDFVAHQQVRFVGRDSSGRLARFRVTYVLNMTPDGPRAAVDIQEASCAGLDAHRG